MDFKYRLIIVFSLSLMFLFCWICTDPVEANEELIISSASSLTSVMKKIKRSYENENPSISLVLNFASSGSLLQQMRLGAPVDVFISANVDFMNRAEENQLIIKETRCNFAAGKLIMITPADSKLSVPDINKTMSPEIITIAIGNPKTVPAGRYAKVALMHAGLWDKIQDKLIFTNSVRQVLDYTARGEVGTGFVYATDAVSTDKVKAVCDVKNTGPIIYPVAITTLTKHKSTGIRFIDFLRSEKGQNILVSSGFNGLNQRG